MSPVWNYTDFVQDAMTRVSEISCEDLARGLEKGDRLVVLDVREGAESDRGVLPGAVLLPRGLIESSAREHVPGLDADVCVYCDDGRRSALAVDVLRRMGYKKSVVLAGGLDRWRHLGLPMQGGKAVCLLSGAKLNWEDVRREFAITGRKVPVLGTGERQLVYLDHAASTHAPASVMNAYVEFIEHQYANIHRGTHLLSRRATERFEESYYVVADFIGAELRRGCVCFTANTTQAIDLASHIVAHRPGKVITTELEHHSNDLPHRRRGSVLRARALDDGSLDMGHLEDLLRKNDVKLVAVTAGSNVTGWMPQIHTIARLAHENGALILVDAAQRLAHAPLDVKSFEDPEHIDFVAGAGHKAYAPFGAGFLYGPRGLMNEAPPYVPGGGTATQVSAFGAEFVPSPDRHQGGTPNIGGVVALAQALLFLDSIGIDEIRKHEMGLANKAMDAIRAIDGVVVYGPPAMEDRIGVISFNVEGVSDMMTAAVLSEEGGLAVRNGRFCAHLYMDQLLRLKHGNAPGAPTGAVRASFGLYNSESDIDRLVEFVARVKNHGWVGHYRVKGDEVNAEFAGRCADQWMEATQEADTLALKDSDSPPGYVFEALQPDQACRSYLIADPSTNVAVIVDPLRERVDDYVDLLTSKGYQLLHTIETHTHADHLSGSMRLKELTGATMLMHAGSPAPCVDQGLHDGDFIQVGNVKIEVLETPGHTACSVCLLLPDRVLTGDTLLIGGCGRTDLPTGDPRRLHGSLHRLMSLPDDTLVFPAHDYKGRRASTIGRERKNNKRVGIEDMQKFQEVMDGLGLAPPDRLDEAIRCNTKCL